jgi:hypothetical protein
MTDTKTFSTGSQLLIEKEIDDFLAEGKPFKPIALILTANGNSRRYEYKGVSVRVWREGNNIRYDAAVELLDGRSQGK